MQLNHPITSLYSIRILIISLTSILATFIIIIICSSLISGDFEKNYEVSRYISLNFVNITNETQVIPKPLEKPKVDELEESSQIDIPNEIVKIPVNKQASHLDSTFLDSSISKPSLSTFGISEGNYFPLVKVKPIYPFSALANEIEGECTVEFTISKNGSTKDVHAVPRECNRLFLKSSVDAAKKFKYKARVLNGETIEVENVKNKFIYRLQN